MLVYEQDGDIFAILREALKGIFNGGVFCLLVDDEEVLLRVRRSGAVLMKCWSAGGSGDRECRVAYANTGKEEACHGVLDWR